MNSWLWAALAAVGGAALWYIMTMNRFARLLVKIRESDSGIEVALTRRFDTLTRMLDVTRAYARHEAGTLGSIVKMRQGMSMAQWSDANSQMDVLHGKINVLAEAYPELRSSENFRVLQASIAEIEEELQDAKGAVFLLGGKVESCENFDLPGSDIHRSLVRIIKVGGCPKKYPRKAGMPTKTPLH